MLQIEYISHGKDKIKKEYTTTTKIS